MKVLVIGGTGYVGLATVEALRAAGHAVTVAARSVPNGALNEEGERAVRADLLNEFGRDLAHREARAHDGVLYLVGGGGPVWAKAERTAVDGLLSALTNSGKPFVFLGGSLVYGDTGPSEVPEDARLRPPPFLVARAEVEGLVRAGAALGVRTSVVHAALVFGRGGGAVPLTLLRAAQRDGSAHFAGDGSNAWSAVHVDDLAELLRLAVERGRPGGVYNASAETPPMRDVARWVARAAGVERVRALSAAEAADLWGFFAWPLSLDQRLASGKARGELGWAPRSVTLEQALTGARRDAPSTDV